jgi:hypothetical protein
MKHAWIWAIAMAVACSSDGKGAESADPDDLEGSADSFFDPLEHGTLLFTGENQYAALEPDANYHVWYFTLGGATPDDPSLVSVGTDYDNRDGWGAEVDTVIYLYRKGDDGRWGRYLYKNDESDSAAPFSTIREVELAPGDYRLIVKGYRRCTAELAADSNSQACGSFSVSGACHDGPCIVPPGPTAEECGWWEGSLDECQGLHGDTFDECLEGLTDVTRDDLRACCELDDILYFCPVPEPVDPALLERCKDYRTQVIACEEDGKNVEQCIAESDFTQADIDECCAADPVFYYCR